MSAGEARAASAPDRAAGGLGLAIACGLVLTAGVAAKVVRDRSPEADRWHGRGIQRLLGREDFVTGGTTARARDARVIFAADAAGAGTAKVRSFGSIPQGGAPIAVQDGELGRTVLEMPFRSPPDGYAALEIEVVVEPEWVSYANLELKLRGSGLPNTLQIALWPGASERGYRAENHLVLQRDGWSRISIPLLRFLDDDGQPWPVQPGPARLLLTLLPFSGWQPDLQAGTMRLDSVELTAVSRASG